MRNIKTSEVIIAFVVITIIALIILPLPPFMLDIFFVINIALSLLILLSTLYIKEALDFSIFPSLLLITTIYRLSLNVSSTRQILLNNGNAGNIVKTFGSFVVGGNIAVGAIVFIVITLVQLMVITKGAERVSEVAARFTLDAMPGKQMAIDADLNSGLIDEMQAKERREKVSREANFYGSMDGASKFVKGDATMGIILTLINIVGGLIMGAMSGMPTDQLISTYSLATIGDGLVSQIPSLLISTSMGVIVTRSAAVDSMGEDYKKQLFSNSLALMITGGAVILISLLPGMPKLQMMLVGGALIAIGILQKRNEERLAMAPQVDNVDEAEAEERRKPENISQLLQVDPIEMDLGYGLLNMLDVSQGGDLLDRVVMIRRQCALEMGIIVPVIRLRDNIQLGASEYSIKIKGVEVARGEVMMDHFLALNPGNALEELEGIETIEPTYGLPALWITETQRERADMLGYTTIDTPSVIATHLTEIIKRYGYELLSRQQVQMLIDNLRQTQPALADEVVPKMFGFGDIQKVLSALLKENVPIRDMTTIIETLGDYGAITRDTELLTEYVRQNLRRTISRRFVPDNRARVITLDGRIEQLISESVKQTEHGSYVAIDPEAMQRILTSLKTNIERLTSLGITPLVLTAPAVRRHFKRLTEAMVPDLNVLSYNELEQDIEIYADGMVSI